MGVALFQCWEEYGSVQLNGLSGITGGMFYLFIWLAIASASIKCHGSTVEDLWSSYGLQYGSWDLQYVYS